MSFTVARIVRVVLTLATLRAMMRAFGRRAS
jgi:hypothetical protein